MGLIIDKNTCVLCGGCVASCPNGALEITDEIILDEEKCILCGACADSCPVGAISIEKEKKEAQEAGGGIWIAVQQSEGKPLPVALELLGKGRELADTLGCRLTAICPGKSSSFARELIEAGADAVLFLLSDRIGDTDDNAYAHALVPLIRERRPEIVLFGATILGRSAAPAIAAKLGTGLTADCTALSIEPDSRLLAQTRPALGGNLMATIVCPDSRPQMATVRPGIFPCPEPDPARTGTVETILPEGLPKGLITILSQENKSDASGIADADILLVAGRGIGSSKNLKKVFRLAELMKAEVGVSRPLIDMGWAEYPHQVGQTGATVAPKLLISLGVSGAIQHLAGIGGAQTVVAVNPDADAPIMRHADYVVKMDCVEFVEQLTELLQAK